MVRSCSVVNCKNRKTKNSKLSFHRLPREENRRRKWLTFLNWKADNPHNTENILVCGDHFLTGVKSEDKNHPDYVPSLNKDKDGVLEEKSLDPVLRAERHKRLMECRFQQDISNSSNNSNSSNIPDVFDHSLYLSSDHSSSFNKLFDTYDDNVTRQSTSTPIPMEIDKENINDDNNNNNDCKAYILELEEKLNQANTTIETLQTKNNILQAKNDILQAENKSLKERNCNLMKENVELNIKVNDAVFKDIQDPEKIKFYTGVPNVFLDKIFKLCEPYINPEDYSTKLSNKQQFFMVLIRLRLGLLEQDF